VRSLSFRPLLLLLLLLFVEGISVAAGLSDAVSGDAVGSANEARFSSPQQIAVAPNNCIFIADRGNNQVCVCEGRWCRDTPYR
jgi:hypothetical protein